MICKDLHPIRMIPAVVATVIVRMRAVAAAQKRKEVVAAVGIDVEVSKKSTLPKTSEVEKGRSSEKLQSMAP